MTSNNTSIKDRLRALPDELFLAREQEYDAFKAHREIEQKLEEEEVLLLQRCPPLGKNAEERRRSSTITLMGDGNIIHYRNLLRSTEDALAARKRDTQKLADEMAALGRLAYIIQSENIKDAAGIFGAAIAGINVGKGRALSPTF